MESQPPSANRAARRRRGSWAASSKSPSEQVGSLGAVPTWEERPPSALARDGEEQATETEQRNGRGGAHPEGRGPGDRGRGQPGCPGASGRVDSWGGGRFSPESFCSLQMLLEKAAEGPPRREGLHFGGGRSGPWGHQALSVVVQLSGLEHAVPRHFLGRASGPIASLLLKSSPRYWSTAEDRMSSRNCETQAVTVSLPLRTWAASFPDSRA